MAFSLARENFFCYCFFYCSYCTRETFYVSKIAPLQSLLMSCLVLGKAWFIRKKRLDALKWRKIYSYSKDLNRDKTQEDKCVLKWSLRDSIAKHVRMSLRKTNILDTKMWTGLAGNIYYGKQNKVMAQAQAQAFTCPYYLTVSTLLPHF